ncbi:MAG TPA: NAD(P)-dependent oxidoreductase [Chromatiales bacterium]|jgi:3-hydroxyisobutyrate dehydrogenase|nr:NAD(P)-dependent oxidoreductase [Chromatiales bacterium]
MKTGVIGLGAMGMPMARNLQRAGYLQAVFNRTHAVADALSAELGTSATTSIEALATQCELIILCVSQDVDVREVVEQLSPGLHPGSVVVDTSTVSSATAVQVSESLHKIGVEFLDIPVSGGVEGATQGTLAMMAGGDAAVLERIAPVLACLASRVEHMGPVGAGQATKAVNQIMAAGINQAVTEALAFAQRMALPLDKVIDVVGSGAAANWFLSHRGTSMTEGRFEPGFRLALHHKDLAICQQMAAAHGVQMPIVEMTRVHYQRLIDAGYGDEDISALYRSKLALFGF